MRPLLRGLPFLKSFAHIHSSYDVTNLQPIFTYPHLFQSAAMTRIELLQHNSGLDRSDDVAAAAVLGEEEMSNILRR